MGKFSIRDAVNAIATTATYQLINQQGGTDQYVSHDFATNGLLENIIREQQYVESLEASKGVAFQLGRDRSRTWIAKEHTAAHQFYRLIAVPKPNQPPAYRLGEVSNLLFEVATELNIRSSMFTGNPMAVVGVDGYREAELANAFGQRVYERKKNTVFKDKHNGQKRRIKQAIAKATRLIERTMDGRCMLRCERFDLVFEKEWTGMSLQEADKRFQRFLEAFADWESKATVAGLWFREHLSETGYRFHLILLVDGFTPASAGGWVSQELEKLWSTATKFRGYVFPLWAQQSQPRTWGSKGLLIDVKGLLLESIALMLNRELYLRLDAPPDMEHFGIIKTSSAIKAETTKKLGIQGVSNNVTDMSYQTNRDPEMHITALPLL